MFLVVSVILFTRKGSPLYRDLAPDPHPPLYRALPHSPCLYRVLVLASSLLLVTSGGQTWRPVQTCSLEDPSPVSGLKTMCQQYIFSSVILDFFLINSTTRTCSQKAQAGWLALSPDRLIISSYHLCLSRDNLLLNISTYFRHV